MTEPVARLAGRVLLVDPDRRVLLLKERLDTGPAHWLTPGGGVEPGERPVEAAVREVREETGIEIHLVPDTEPVFVDRDVWSWAGLTYDQENHFFLARVPAGVEMGPRALTELELQTQLGQRWWTVAELRATGQIVYPVGLADILERVIGDPPVGG